MDTSPPRPPSILLFERLYLAALAISIVTVALHWSVEVSAMMARPDFARVAQAARFVPALYWILHVVIWAAWVLIWYLVARRGSKVARIVAAIGALISAYDGIDVLLAMLGGPLAGWFPVAVVAEAALLVAAVAMLFRADARPWFAPGADAAVEPV